MLVKPMHTTIFAADYCGVASNFGTRLMNRRELAGLTWVAERAPI
jgi:hypothetical protein